MYAAVGNAQEARDRLPVRAVPDYDQPVRPSTGKISLARFVEPPWDAELDSAREIECAPPSAQISGMFIAPLVAADAKASRGARARIIAFSFYSLREHMQRLVQVVQNDYPELALRQGLRKLGRGAPGTFISSTLGKVMLGSADGVNQAVDAMARAYEVNMKPGQVRAAAAGPSRMIVSLEEIYSFIDSHHVGVFEGVMKYAGVRGRVRIWRTGAASAELLLEW
jgi:uncharacterized protein (TIGR02265 family)